MSLRLNRHLSHEASQSDSTPEHNHIQIFEKQLPKCRIPRNIKRNLGSSYSTVIKIFLEQQCPGHVLTRFKQILRKGGRSEAKNKNDYRKLFTNPILRPHLLRFFNSDNLALKYINKHAKQGNRYEMIRHLQLYREGVERGQMTRMTLKEDAKLDSLCQKTQPTEKSKGLSRERVRRD